MNSENDEIEEEFPEGEDGKEVIHTFKSSALGNLYKDWFLDYASYVILERAVPALLDGLKPVQRRIFHAMKEMDDGRYNKVANIIGQTMQYHPHGDASIGDALVNIGQKDLLIDTQGNWGDVRTGDSAAAPRYIEARLSKFALDILFNEKITDWQLSYDGRKREPLMLPVKFPLLLALGADGIAVGLSTKILPHNFCELLLASIQILKGKKVTLYPDFINGGEVDVSNYKNGNRGGKIRVRAIIEEIDKSTIAIKTVPYGTTTSNLIDSILKANDSGKIRIKNVSDNTAKDVEIIVNIAPGITTWQTIDALYAFTDCEVSLSPNTCVVYDNKPVFLGVEDILEISTKNTLGLLKRELEIRRSELLEILHFASLEKIFIENRIYRKIEECETYEDVLVTIEKALVPYTKQFIRKVTREDVIKLTEIRIKRISKFDSYKADEHIKNTTDELDQVNNDLDNIVAYGIRYFENLLRKYGKGKERQTAIKTFDVIQAQMVAVNNAKLYANKAEGFVGMGLKKDEFICDCSDIDDVLVIRADGKMLVSKIEDKAFLGKDILYVGIYKRNDEGLTFNVIYSEGKNKPTRLKRFKPGGVTRDKLYDIAGSNKDAHILYLSANNNEETESVKIYLKNIGSIRKLEYDFDFQDIAIKGRNSQGNIIARTPVKSVKYIEQTSTNIKKNKLWYDTETGRIVTEDRGNYMQWIGSMSVEETLLVIYKNGFYELTPYELNKKLDSQNVLRVFKFVAENELTIIYLDDAKNANFLKRFLIDTLTLDRKFSCTREEGQKILFATDHPDPEVEVKTGKNLKNAIRYQWNLAQLEDVKKSKSIGYKLTDEHILEVNLINPVEEPEDEAPEEETPKSKKEPLIEELDSKEILEEHIKTKQKNTPKNINQTSLF